MLPWLIAGGISVVGLLVSRALTPSSPSFQCHCSCASSGLGVTGVIGGLVLIGLAAIVSLLILEVKKLRNIVASSLHVAPTATASAIAADLAQRAAIADSPSTTIPGLVKRGPPVKRGLGIFGTA